VVLRDYFAIRSFPRSPGHSGRLLEERLEDIILLNSIESRPKTHFHELHPRRIRAGRITLESKKIRHLTDLRPARPSPARPKWTIRAPQADDGVRIHDLVRGCPPLDENSLYCNLIQCIHFAETCAIAEDEGRLVGWISGYRLPRDPSALFVWQVAIASEARGVGLAIRMVDDILARPANRDLRRIEASVTPSNLASTSMFQRLARHRNADLEWSTWLDRFDHFEDRHDTEWLLRIEPVHPRADRSTTSASATKENR